MAASNAKLDKKETGSGEAVKGAFRLSPFRIIVAMISFMMIAVIIMLTSESMWEWFGYAITDNVFAFFRGVGNRAAESGDGELPELPDFLKPSMPTTSSTTQVST